jgi:hypothetical protein
LCTIRALYKMNNERPEPRRFNDDQIAEKVLSCFKASINGALSYAAMTELAAEPHERLFQRPDPNGGPGMRDIHSLQNKWEPQWRLNFQQGGISGGRRGNHADGALRVDAPDTDRDEAAFIACFRHGADT